MKKKLLTLLQIFLAKCAKFYLYRTKPKVIGITGSVGKTSCRMIVTGVLKKYLPNKKIYTSEKNFNSELWLVFTIFQVKTFSPSIKELLFLTIKIFIASLFRWKKYDILLLEYWIDHPWDMDFLLWISKPDYAIFTKLDKIHSVYFDTQNWIWDEKIKLLQNSKVKSYLNPLEEFCVKIFDELVWNKEYFDEIKNYKLEKTTKTLWSKFEYKNKTFITNLIWKENIDYIWVAFQILNEFWGKEIENDFLELNIQWWRFSIFEGISDSILIDSSYNAGPVSMKKMIENTFSIRDQLFKNYKIILVLWEMRELWDDIIEEEHKKLFKFLNWVEAVFMIGQGMQYLEKELNDNKFEWFHKKYIKSNIAWIELKKYLQKNNEKYIILFKWSQNTIFTEETLKEILFDKKDEQKLVRQSYDWITKKQKFFT